MWLADDVRLMGEIRRAGIAGSAFAVEPGARLVARTDRVAEPQIDHQGLDRSAERRARLQTGGRRRRDG